MMQVNLQVLTAMLDLGADPQQAVEAPRWTSVQQGQGANWPHDGDCRLTVEPGFGQGRSGTGSIAWVHSRVRRAASRRSESRRTA